MADTAAPRWALPGGLRLVPARPLAAVRAVVLAILGVTALVVLIDAVAFRADLPASYVAKYTSPLWPRILFACAGSAGEELVWRLGLMTALAAVPGLLGRRAGAGWMIAAIVMAQFANVAPLVIAMPAYAIWRFWLAGCVWGWLYWRHGFVSALAGHGLCHLLLDPVLRAALLATA